MYALNSEELGSESKHTTNTRAGCNNILFPIQNYLLERIKRTKLKGVAIEGQDKLPL